MRKRESGEGVPGVIAASLTVRAQGWACDPHLTEYRFHFWSPTPLTVTVAALSQKAHTLIHNLFLSLSHTHTHTHTHAHTYMHTPHTTWNVSKPKALFSMRKHTSIQAYKHTSIQLPIPKPVCTTKCHRHLDRHPISRSLQNAQNRRTK